VTPRGGSSSVLSRACCAGSRSVSASSTISGGSKPSYRFDGESRCAPRLVCQQGLRVQAERLDVRMRPTLDVPARSAYPTGNTPVRTFHVGAAECLGKRSSRRRLTDSRGTRKQICVPDSLAANCILQPFDGRGVDPVRPAGITNRRRLMSGAPAVAPGNAHIRPPAVSPGAA
jgi:hypothetical protein